jgi:hypothetical protein
MRNTRGVTIIATSFNPTSIGTFLLHISPLDSQLPLGRPTSNEPSPRTRGYKFLLGFK